MRCLPSYINVATIQSGVFSDSACTIPVAYFAYSASYYTGCVARYATAPVSNSPYVCTPIGTDYAATRVFALGAKLELAAPTFSNSGGPCVPYTRGTAYDFFEVGAEVPASQFVQFTTG